MRLGLRSVLLSLLLIGTAANAAVQASLDNTQVAPGDTVQLILQHDGSTDDQPDLSPLKQDFDILSTSRSSNVSIINGNTSSQTQVQLTLSPKHSGQLTVPAISWSKDHSAPLSLTVSNAAGGSKDVNSQGALGKVFMETTVDQAQPYVQAAVKVTVRLYAAQQLYQADLDLPISSDALVQQVGSDQSSLVEKGGERYRLIERHYLVFPQRSGKLTLPGAVLNAQVATRDRFDPFGNDVFGNVFGNSPLGGMLTRAKPIRVHGDPVVLNVRPRPASAIGYWLPARNVSVKAQWRPESLQVPAGEPITVDLQLQAEGLTAAQLPDLSPLLNVPGLKMYPDQAKLNNNTKGDTVFGSREQSIALIADQAGKFTLPEIKVQWWDTQTNQVRETSVSAQVLTMLPPVGGQRQANAVPAPMSASSSATENYRKETSVAPPVVGATGNGIGWLWLSVGLGALWIATVAAWYWSHRRSKTIKATAPAAPARQELRLDAARARNDFYDACRRNDAPGARRHLLNWLAAALPDTAPAGLRAFAKQLNDANFTPLLLALDRACYAGASWKGMPLLEALRELPKRYQHNRDREPRLAALYH